MKNNNETPLVSVLLPVYNVELYIEEALCSILNQTYTNFECIVIDDASTDRTVQIIESVKDDRIVLIKKEKNTGYTKNLNEGIKLCKGKYIARMDGDDISYPERFQKQVHFLEENTDIVLCGTQYKVIGRDKYSHHPTNHDELKVKLITGSYIAHPSVMMRASVLKDNELLYDETMEPAEDHDLWSKMVFLGKVANLNEVLLEYRVHANQVSQVRKQQQLKVSSDIKNHMLKKVNNDFYIFNLNTFLNANIVEAFTFYKNHVLLYNSLIEKNKMQPIYSHKYFNQLCKNEIKKLDIKLSEKVKNNSFYVLKKQLFNFSFFKNLGFVQSSKFVFKSLFVNN